MVDSMLQRIRDRVRAKAYIMPLHAEEEMDNDGLTIFDVEHIILTGQIVERQRDQHSDEQKYLIQGQTELYEPAYVVVKFLWNNTLVIITVYLA